MTDLTLTTERMIKAPQKDIFDAWLNPDFLRKFMIPGSDMDEPETSNDPKVGGRFDIVMKAGGNEIPHSGIYQEIDPHNRIVFTWESPFSPADSTVTLTFDAVAEGTHVTLTQVRFLDEERRDNHLGGWTRILETLDSVLS